MRGKISVNTAVHCVLVGFLAFIVPQISHSQSTYLTEAEVRETLDGHTLMGRDWAEFYLSDGTIKGRARYFGAVRSYTGAWSVSGNKVCYDYEGTFLDPCSRLKRDGSTVYHFTLDGAAKTDGVAKRFDGDNLRGF